MPDEYFARYGHHLSQGCSGGLAFRKTEMDFFRMYGCRRYRTYGSFREALCRWRRGNKVKTIVLYVPEEFDHEKK